jgi:hypothetical protein
LATYARADGVHRVHGTLPDRGAARLRASATEPRTSVRGEQIVGEMIEWLRARLVPAGA